MRTVVLVHRIATPTRAAARAAPTAAGNRARGRDRVGSDPDIKLSAMGTAITKRHKKTHERAGAERDGPRIVRPIGAHALIGAGYAPVGRSGWPPKRDRATRTGAGTGSSESGL